MSVVSDFREFVLRGNVVDLAVGVVIGSAFGAVVTSFVKDLLTPLISIPGKVNFSDFSVKVGGASFQIGNFINAVISFLLISFAIFFFVVKPVNYLMTRFKTEKAVEATTRECPQCISQVPLAAKRCAFCTSEIAGPA